MNALARSASPGSRSSSTSPGVAPFPPQDDSLSLLVPRPRFSPIPKPPRIPFYPAFPRLTPDLNFTDRLPADRPCGGPLPHECPRVPVSEPVGLRIGGIRRCGRQGGHDRPPRDRGPSRPVSLVRRIRQAPPVAPDRTEGIPKPLDEGPGGVPPGSTRDPGRLGGIPQLAPRTVPLSQANPDVRRKARKSSGINPQPEEFFILAQWVGSRRIVEGRRYGRGRRILP